MAGGKPKILFTTRSLRSLEDTESTEKTLKSWELLCVLCVLCGESLCSCQIITWRKVNNHLLYFRLEFLAGPVRQIKFYNLSYLGAPSGLPPERRRRRGLRRGPCGFSFTGDPASPLKAARQSAARSC